MKMTRMAVAAVAAGAVLAMIAGCSSSSEPAGTSSSDTSTGASSASETAAEGESSGAASSETASSETATTDSPAYHIWYADVMDSNPVAMAVTQGFNDTLVSNNVAVTRSLAIDSSSGQIDLAVQGQALTRAVAAAPDAIAYFVLDPTAFQPQLEQAMGDGIPVFAALGKPAFAVNGYISMDDEGQGYAAAKYLAENLEPGATVAIIGGPATPNVLAEEKGALKAFEDAGVTVVGDIEQQRNLDDNAAGGQAVMQSILQRFPDVDGVFVYNDDSVLGAIAAAKQAGATVKFTSRNGTADAVAAVKAGDLLATCDIQPVALGRALGQAVVDQLTGKHDFQNSESIPPPDSSACLVTADNADSWKPSEDLVEYRDITLG
jgi:ribose transport system substrate-binding protein